jgi:hypothetical protein
VRSGEQRLALARRGQVSGGLARTARAWKAAVGRSIASGGEVGQGMGRFGMKGGGAARRRPSCRNRVVWFALRCAGPRGRGPGRAGPVWFAAAWHGLAGNGSARIGTRGRAAQRRGVRRLGMKSDRASATALHVKLVWCGEHCDARQRLGPDRTAPIRPGVVSVGAHRNGAAN